MRNLMVILVTLVFSLAVFFLGYNVGNDPPLKEAIACSPIGPQWTFLT